ncbi:sarcosine oxidase subunit delta [Burkholderia pyrrocinia]|uniref:sarcosine oxidase subunit delta n=1 Tax=Burkholderia pyrrocinia TaxID=60550 RepID=UPI002AB2F723|nr:sarcosine oxidase subunit delta [Burkholderia pyrrocinia]
MLEINCPFCGRRPESEFWCIGEGAAIIPGMDTTAAEVQRYLYFRSNSGGNIVERWVHRLGCGEWLSVTRNTYSNAILSVSFLNEVTANGSRHAEG